MEETNQSNRTRGAVHGTCRKAYFRRRRRLSGYLGGAPASKLATSANLILATSHTGTRSLEALHLFWSGLSR